MLKKETEVVIRGLLASDKSVAPEDIEKAIAYLQGRRDEDEDLTHVIRYKDVLKWLKIHSRTLDYYIQRGYLKRVYGGGECAIGVSRDSYRKSSDALLLRCSDAEVGQDRASGFDRPSFFYSSPLPSEEKNDMMQMFSSEE